MTLVIKRNERRNEEEKRTKKRWKEIRKHVWNEGIKGELKGSTGKERKTVQDQEKEKKDNGRKEKMEMKNAERKNDGIEGGKYKGRRGKKRIEENV